MNNLRHDVKYCAKNKVLGKVQNMVKKHDYTVQHFIMGIVGDFANMLKTKELVFDNVIIGSSHWDKD